MSNDDALTTDKAHRWPIQHSIRAGDIAIYRIVLFYSSSKGGILRPHEFTTDGVIRASRKSKGHAVVIEAFGVLWASAFIGQYALVGELLAEKYS